MRMRRRAGLVASVLGLLAAPGTASAALYEVTTLDDAGPGSLRQAMTDANASPDADTIAFAATLAGTLQLASALPPLQGEIAIRGPQPGTGPPVITIRGEGVADSYRILDVAAGADARVSSLRLTNGRAAEGGGVRSAGTLELQRVRVDGNVAIAVGGGIAQQGAGARLSVLDSEISANRVGSGTAGSGIDVSGGQAVVRGSTVTQNTALGAGVTDAAGIVAYAAGTAVTVENSTVAGNTDGTAANVNVLAADGGAVSLRSTIVALPGGGVNCRAKTAGTITSAGFNLEDTATCGLAQPTDQAGVDPRLGPLADNGGTTRTMALPGNSPAVDGGSTVSGLFRDARGDQRTVDLPGVPNAGDGTDVGAFELNFSVTALDDSGPRSLRRALGDANLAPGPDVVRATVSGTLQLQSALPLISDGVTLRGPSGPGAGRLTIRGQGAAGGYRVLTNVAPVDETVRIEDLDVQNGHAGSIGGGIANAGNMIIQRVAVTGNAGGNGGGVANTGQTALLVLGESLVAGNTASGPDAAGGVRAQGAVLVSRSTIAQNTATNARSAGGLLVDGAGASALIYGSTVAGNTGAGTGAGNLGLAGGTAELSGTIVADAGGGPNCRASGGGTFTTTGFNLEDTATTCGLTAPSDVVGLDPGLGPLADNGGPTGTLALTAASPAVDRGRAQTVGDRDQRGLSRPVDLPGVDNASGGDGTDIGAYEVPDLEVRTTADSGPGSLRAAVLGAEISAGPDTITFRAGVSGTVDLASPLPTIFGPVTITGPGADVLTVRRTGAQTFSVLRFSGSTATVSGLTLSGGAAFQGAGVDVVNGSDVTLERVAVVDNTSTGIAAGVTAAAGAQLRVLDSLIAGNTLSGSGGDGAAAVAVYSGGKAVLRSTTVTGNTATGDRATGGIGVFSSGSSVEATGSTIARNRGGSLTGANVLGQPGSVTLRSTILAEPQGGRPSCSAADVVVSLGHNLEDGSSCGLTGPADRSGADPALGPLAATGGPTKTLALALGSPAIDTGVAAAGVTADQRGSRRPVDIGSVPNAAGGDGSDVGAYELDFTDQVPPPAGPPPPPPPATTTTPPVTAAGEDPDGDGVRGAADRCAAKKGPKPSGCPLRARTLSARYAKATRRISGRLTAPPFARACRSGERVRVYRLRPGRIPDVPVASVRTTTLGTWAVRRTLRPGTYYARVLPRVIKDVAVCGARSSRLLRVRASPRPPRT